MTIDELVSRMRDSLRATVVYAPPYEKDGLTVIPAAVVLGGGGGGEGTDTKPGKNTGTSSGGTHGEGGGFGLFARPAGAFVIENGTVRWVPALDATRLIGMGVVVALALTKRFHRRRAKARLRG
ncbi:sporulation protein [Actinophytocola sp.]|uniref:sporulation protein n=1 Tax=Actinophytocola sp. TaxID=1872138 RepID=UPI003D6B059B